MSAAKSKSERGKLFNDNISIRAQRSPRVRGIGLTLGLRCARIEILSLLVSLGLRCARIDILSLLLRFTNDDLNKSMEKLALSADKMGLSKKITSSDQVIWVSLR